MKYGTKRAIIENSRHVMLVVDHPEIWANAMVNMGISMVDAVLHRCDAAGRGTESYYGQQPSAGTVLNGVKRRSPSF